jgi:hypothetical protein
VWGFKFRFAELQTDLKKMDDACKKIKLAVANIAKNRSKFAHVDDAELESRQAAITELEKVNVAVLLCNALCCEPSSNFTRRT